MSSPLPTLDYAQPARGLDSSRGVLFALLLIGITLVAYVPVLRGGFIWDDDDYVTTRRALTTPAGLIDIWFHPSASPQYYPMVFTSFWIEHAIWGLNASGYHFVNVLLHSLAALLLWRVLALLKIPAAFLAACLFAIHPINVESVAWITERKNVLSAVFYFASALTFLRGRHIPALLLFTAALLSKSVTCSLPAALLLLIWWKQRKLTWRDQATLAAMFALGVTLAGVTISLERSHVSAIGPEWDFSSVDRILIAGRAVWFYATKLLVSIDLSFVYPKWIIAPALMWQWAFPLGVVVALTALWLNRDRWGRGPLVAALFFVGTLVPALGFFNIYPMRYTFVADHYVYIAGVGLIVLLAEAIHRLGRAAPVSVIAILMILTMIRANVFHDVEPLWRDTLAKNPDSWMVNLNLAKVLDARGDDAGAQFHFQRQAALAPNVPDAHMDYGTFLSNHERYAEALKEHYRALELNPRLPQVHYHLARTYQAMGRLDEAIAEYRQALALRPDYAVAHAWLARAFNAAGRTDEARVESQEAIRLDPSLWVPMKSLTAQ